MRFGLCMIAVAALRIAFVLSAPVVGFEQAHAGATPAVPAAYERTYDRLTRDLDAAAASLPAQRTGAKTH